MENATRPAASAEGTNRTDSMPQGQAPPPPNARPEITDLARDVFDRKHHEHLDADTLESVLTSLLAVYPDAPVGAHRSDGVMVAMPDSVPLLRNPVLEARSGLDLIIHDDVVLKGWDRVAKEGAARYPVHPVGRPDITGMVYGLDLREKHGVILVLSVFSITETADDPAGRPETPAVTPRFATLWKDQRGFVMKIDEALTQILGWSSEEMEGHRSLEFIHPEDHSLAIDNWLEMLASPGLGRRVRLRHLHRDESWVWFECTNHNLFDDPDYQCVVSEMVDISEEMAAHEELKAREQLLDGLAEAIPVGLFQVDAQRRIVYTNDRLHQILGVERTDTVDDQLITVTDANRPQLEHALEESLEHGRQVDVEVELHVPPRAEVRFCTISLRALSQENGAINGAIACVADITDSARMREELKRRATFDELTGCYNRASIMDALESNIASGQRQAERAVVFVDLDCFKAINDEHGHAVGDEVLSIVAERLRRVVRDGDMVGRIGGDEFLAVCPDIGGPEHAMKLAERLAEAQSEPANVASGSVVVQVSIGVAWSSGEGADADSIVAKADGAMYASKREGSGQPKIAPAVAAVSPIAGAI
jgi:diguanylate cyclase (GGDEF)-like protein/PAS domain S-box-containing protein